MLRVGDRVIQINNDYDNEVFNGDIGWVETAGAGGVSVAFDGRIIAYTGELLRNLTLAWAISIHKSQGSEYQAVIIVIHKSHRLMLQRNILYTAITRARSFCCLIDSPWAIETAVRCRDDDARHTRLIERLKSESMATW